MVVFHFSKLLLERPNEVCAVNGTAIAEYCRDDLGCVAIPSKCLNSVFDQPVHWITVRTFWEISVRAVLGIHIAIRPANCANERICWQDFGIAPCDTGHVSLLYNAGLYWWFHAGSVIFMIWTKLQSWINATFAHSRVAFRRCLPSLRHSYMIVDMELNPNFRSSMEAASSQPAVSIMKSWLTWAAVTELYQHRPQIPWKCVIYVSQLVSHRFITYIFLHRYVWVGNKHKYRYIYILIHTSCYLYIYIYNNSCKALFSTNSEISTAAHVRQVDFTP